MQNIAVIRLVHGRLAWYPPGASEEPRWLDQESAREQLRATVSQRRVVPVFAAPGSDVRLLRLTITPEEKKHIGKSLPFMLEERVAEDIDTLHFASCPLDRLELAVAVCTEQKMADWQERLADLGAVNQWLPEPLLLPWQSGEWCLVLEEGQAVVRTGRCEGFAIERDMVPALLAGALQEGGEPEAVIIYGEEQAADTASLLRQFVGG